MWARIVVEWSLIAACLAAVGQWPGVLAVWLAALVVGSRQHALAILGHWALHRLLAAPKLAQWLCLLPLGIDPARLRDMHFAHHRAPGRVGVDLEAEIVQRFAARWRQPIWWDSVLDAVGLHADESALILARLTSRRAVACYAATVAAIGVMLGPWAAAVWPLASITGLMVCHRLRARTEHDHLSFPGITLSTRRPSLLARAIYLPHHTWLHSEHHARPNVRVWA